MKKMKEPCILLAIIAAAALGCAALLGCAKPLLGGTARHYYVQVDNAKVVRNERDGGVVSFTGHQPFLYTLSAYSESGGEKTLKFGTSRELRNGAFLRLTYSPLRGVTEWREVRYEELPEAVRVLYSAPEQDEAE